MGVIELVNPSEIDTISVCPCIYLNYCEPSVRTTRISTVTNMWDYGSRENQYRATRFSTIAKWEMVGDTLADPGGYIGGSKDLSPCWNATE